MQKIANFMYLVMPLVYALFIGVQVGINQQDREAIQNHAETIIALDQKVNNVLALCSTNIALVRADVRQIDRNHTELLRFTTNNADVVSLTIQNQQKLIGQIVETAKSDRATVKVMSGLFCERVKDHATLFEMVGRLSMAVGSLTNVLKFAQMPEVR